LIYDGIHYDPLGVINSDGTPMQTVFDSEDDGWLAVAHQVGDEARKVIKDCNIQLSKKKLSKLAFLMADFPAILGYCLSHV
jgi:flagellar basal body rod protein FlgF